jgi:phosphate transport system substrate-binding protein
MSYFIESAAEYQDGVASIGYTFKFYLDSLYKNENINIIKINGIEPTQDNIQSGTYPFTTNYYGVIRAEDKDGVGEKFLDWILSGEGQECIEQEGYCSLTVADK